MIWPSPLASPGLQAEADALPRAMFTMVRMSLTVTWPSLLQSPTHGVGVNVGAAVRVGVLVAVVVGVVVGVGVFDAVAVGV